MSNKSEPALPLRRASRKYAVQYLYQLDVSEESFSDRSLERFWAQAEEMSASYGLREWRKLQESVRIFVAGVIARREELDGMITRHLRNWELKRLAAVDRNILRLGAWELRFSAPEVPAASVINEAVVLAKAFGSDDSSSFINAVLDAIHKEAPPAGDAS